MSTSTTSYAEKRSERRFPIHSQVSISLVNKQVIKGVCLNVSGSGLLVKSEKAILVGSVVQLDIQEGRIDFKADAEVVRCEHDNGAFLLGLKMHQKRFD